MTNATFQYSRAIHAVFRRTDHVPAKMRAFLDFFAAERLRGEAPAG